MMYELNWTNPFLLIGQYKTEGELLDRVRVFIDRCREEHVPLPSMTFLWRDGRQCGVFAEGESLIERASRV